MLHNLRKFLFPCFVESVVALFFSFYLYQYGPQEQYEPFFQTNGAAMAVCLFVTMMVRVTVARLVSVKAGLIASLTVGLLSVCLFLKYPIIRESAALSTLFLGFIVCFLTDQGDKVDRLVRIVLVVLGAIGVVFVVHFVISFVTLDEGAAIGPDFLQEAIDCVVFAISYIIGYQVVGVRAEKNE